MTTFLHLSRGLRTVPLLPLLFAAFTLTGCGGGDGSSTTTTSAPPPTPELSLAVQDIKTLRLSWTGTGQATGYRLFVETDASAARTAVATLPADTTQHDLQVFLPDQVNARYILQACNAAGCTDTAPANVATALLNSAAGRFPGTVTKDEMGIAVTLSANGRTLAVGAPGDDHQVTDSGAVYLFNRGPSGWVTQAMVKAPTPATDDRFGVALALSSDGQRLVVGVHGPAGTSSEVRVFDLAQGQWRQSATLQSSGVAWGFGERLSLSADGQRLAVSAMYEPLHTSPEAAGGRAAVLSEAGAVYLFDLRAGHWTQTQRLNVVQGGDGDLFGSAVSLSGDGRWLASGARLEDGGTNGIDARARSAPAPNSGAVYVYAPT